MPSVAAAASSLASAGAAALGTAAPPHASSSSSAAASSSAHRLAAHHPFRLHVQDVTPVSISLLWSLRPPPISALHGAYPPVPRPSFAAPASLPAGMRRRAHARAAARSSQPQTQPNRHDDWDEDGATAVEEGSDSAEAEAEAFDEASLEGHASRTAPPHAGGDSDSETSDTAGGPEEGSAAHPGHGARLSKIFESGVSVTVNGLPWPQVVMGDRGSDEAVIVVYGLMPNQHYEMELSVGGRDAKVSVGQVVDGERAIADISASASLHELTGSSDSALVSEAHVVPVTPLSASTSSPQRLKLIVPNGAADVAPQAHEAAHAALLSDIETSSAEREALASELRKARKDAQRAEGAMRAEIEAIKRGMERMAGPDHRSKQKVLALQESIRQATVQARELDEEAVAAEGERPDWEEKERVRDAELAEVRSTVEASEERDRQEISKIEEEVGERERELALAARAVEQKETERNRLDNERRVELEAEIARLRNEMDRVLNAPPPPPGGSYHPSHMRPVPTAASFVPTQALPRARSGAAGGARGAGSSRGPPGRSTSGPNVFAQQRRGGRPGGASPLLADNSGGFAGFGPSPVLQSAGAPGGSPGLSPDAFPPPGHGAFPHSPHSFAPSPGNMALDPNKPEFVPSLGGSTASPVVSKARVSPAPLSASSPSSSAFRAAQVNAGYAAPASPTTASRFAPRGAIGDGAPHPTLSLLTHSVHGAAAPAGISPSTMNRSPVIKQGPSPGSAPPGLPFAPGVNFDVNSSRRGSFGPIDLDNFDSFGPGAPGSGQAFGWTATGPPSGNSSPWAATVGLPLERGAEIWGGANPSAAGTSSPLRTRASIPLGMDLAAAARKARDGTTSPIGSAPVSPTSPNALPAVGTGTSSPRAMGSFSRGTPPALQVHSAPGSEQGGAHSASPAPLTFASVAAAEAGRREASA
ncbi:hypothetical protein FA09DRAFT_345202 [Tilletiopsis washingtonensis]|uniref:Uncharacterized protein n=1 Tax=Tilletiopsis washingtonensis TaxID=58919 RepID=A0A316ZG45_9BASI|nr:hypothetical protein FA09DRAFT_345202 [Tilletiopsis washingtonensis]PWO00009.1 hypothetical protein FA09DRAFT_345202 [Tilletiopsis washingtonensis]